MTSSLQQAIPPGSLADVAFLDSDEVAALEHLVTEGLRPRDLRPAESALRAWILFPRIVPLEGGFPATLTAAMPDVCSAAEISAISVSFSTNDPVLPPALQESLAAGPNMVSAYLSAQASAVAPQGGVIGYAISAADVEPQGVVASRDGSAQAVPLHGLADVFGEAMLMQARAQRLMVAYLGGAALFNRTKELPEPGAHVGGLLEEIDKWFDPPAANGSLFPEIAVPAFLSMVLNTASQRTDIAEVVLEFRDKLIAGARKFHGELSRVHEPCSPRERADRIRSLHSEAARWCALTQAHDQSRRVRIRALAISAASLGISIGSVIFGHAEFAIAMFVNALGFLNQGAGGVWPHLDRPLSPSLADTLYAPLARAAREVNYALLEKHLTPAELAAFKLAGTT